MAEFFGDLERFAADLYPYRWPIAAGVLVALAAVTAFGFRSGWHVVIWRRRRPAAIIGIPVLILVGIVGYDLGSPLFTNRTVEEEFPLSFTAVVPPNMSREQVEEVMAGIAMVDQTADEAMPDMMAMTEPPVGAISEPVKLKAGSFRNADSFHRGSGRATVYRGPDGSLLLRLEDFKVTNGPALHVILSPHQDPKSQHEVRVPGYVDLGNLKGNIGNQNYPIPEEIDITTMNSVVIYCKPFHVVFSVAPLQDVE